LIFLSVNNIVIAAAKTGKAKHNKIAVIRIDQQNNGILLMYKPLDLIKQIVIMKFIAPKTEDKPAKCKLNINKSRAALGDPIKLLNGGYKVQPTAAPFSTQVVNKNKNIEDGSNQKLKLFNLGKAISGAPINNGINQFPKAPINIGIAAKKIITSP